MRVSRSHEHTNAHHKKTRQRARGLNCVCVCVRNSTIQNFRHFVESAWWLGCVPRTHICSYGTSIEGAYSLARPGNRSAGDFYRSPGYEAFSHCSVLYSDMFYMFIVSLFLYLRLTGIHPL